MQIEQVSAEGLKREFKVVVPAEDVDVKVNSKLKELSQQVQMKGFRPGKVPVKLLKQMHGRAVLGEVLEEMVNETSKKALDDNDLRPATQPSIEITTFDDGTELEYKMSVEVLPEFEIADLSKLELTKQIAEVPEDRVEDALNRLAQDQKTFTKVEEDREAVEGDALMIDFVGSVDGEEFEGGAAEDMQLVLGSGQFIPGFEDQLIGKKAGDKVDVNVTFPEEYGAEHLAGKDALFKVEVKELREGAEPEINDEMAKNLGLEDLEALKKVMGERIGEEYNNFTRMHLKRAVLDALDEGHAFEVPEGLYNAEYDTLIGQKLQEAGIETPAEEHDHDHDHDHDHAPKRPDDSKLSQEDRDEVAKLANRRVRMGLVISEIGRINKLEVGAEELNREIMRQASQFPGQERAVMEYFQKNPEAMAQIQMPLFEDKVIDYIVELAQVTEVKVSPEDLTKDPDADEESAAETAE